jgi:hypothetical protein
MTLHNQCRHHHQCCQRLGPISVLILLLQLSLVTWLVYSQYEWSFLRPNCCEKNLHFYEHLCVTKVYIIHALFIKSNQKHNMNEKISYVVYIIFFDIQLFLFFRLKKIKPFFRVLHNIYIKVIFFHSRFVIALIIRS